MYGPSGTDGVLNCREKRTGRPRTQFYRWITDADRSPSQGGHLVFRSDWHQLVRYPDVAFGQPQGFGFPTPTRATPARKFDFGVKQASNKPGVIRMISRCLG